jgi:hypothetical protein
MTFSGFRSRCSTPWACNQSSVDISRNITFAASTSEYLPSSITRSNSILPSRPRSTAHQPKVRGPQGPRYSSTSDAPAADVLHHDLDRLRGLENPEVLDDVLCTGAIQPPAPQHRLAPWAYVRMYVWERGGVVSRATFTQVAPWVFCELAGKACGGRHTGCVPCSPILRMISISRRVVSMVRSVVMYFAFTMFFMATLAPVARTTPSCTSLETPSPILPFEAYRPAQSPDCGSGTLQS